MCRPAGLLLGMLGKWADVVAGSGSGSEHGAVGGLGAESWELQEWRRIEMPTQSGGREDGMRDQHTHTDAGFN